MSREGPREDHFRTLERFYHRAPITRWMGFRLEVGEGEATVRVQARTDFHHAAGAVHGSVLFRTLDDAAFFAAQSLDARHFVLTTSFDVHFLRPVVEGELVATGRVLHRSRRQTLAEAEVRDARGKPVARGTGTFMASHMALEALEGYR